MSGSGHYVKYDLAINAVYVAYVLCRIPAAVCADAVIVGLFLYRRRTYKPMMTDLW
jgi:hypothetical protein